MMLHPDMNDDVLSLSMFWAGLMMVFTPLIAASIVILVWRRGKARSGALSASGSTDEHGHNTGTHGQNA